MSMLKYTLFLFLDVVDEVEDDYDCGRNTGICVKMWSFGYAATIGTSARKILIESVV